MITTSNVQTLKSRFLHEIPALKDYLPFIAGLFLVFIMSSLLHILRPDMTLGFHGLMNNVMGSFFLVFALPKLFNVSGFVESFRRYDFLGRHSKPYAYSYPFIEICLGLSFLSKTVTGSMVGSFIINVLVLAITAPVLLGVAQSLRKRQNLTCACMGSLFKIPLSKVALFESGIMIVMALSMLVFSSHSNMIMATMSSNGVM
jgi:hypothetical protein